MDDAGWVECFALQRLESCQMPSFADSCFPSCPFLFGSARLAHGFFCLSPNHHRFACSMALRFANGKRLGLQPVSFLARVHPCARTDFLAARPATLSANLDMRVGYVRCVEICGNGCTDLLQISRTHIARTVSACHGVLGCLVKGCNGLQPSAHRRWPILAAAENQRPLIADKVRFYGNHGLAALEVSDGVAFAHLERLHRTGRRPIQLPSKQQAFSH